MQADGFIPPGSQFVDGKETDFGGWIKTDSGLEVTWFKDTKGDIVSINKEWVRDVYGKRIERRSMTTHPTGDGMRRTEFEITDSNGDFVLQRWITGPDPTPRVFVESSTQAKSHPIHPRDVPSPDLSVDFIATSGTVTPLSGELNQRFGAIRQEFVYDDGTRVSIAIDKDGNLVSWHLVSKMDKGEQRIETVTQDPDTGYRTDRKILDAKGNVIWNEMIIAKNAQTPASIRPEYTTVPDPLMPRISLNLSLDFDYDHFFDYQVHLQPKMQMPHISEK